MLNLEVKYMGLTLGNPIIAASSGLTNSINKIKQLEKYGVGAVVLKSLFEEQILNDIISKSNLSNNVETFEYVKNYKVQKSVDDYLQLIKDAKKEISVPIIASINCISSNDWISFAKKIQDAGADGLELNVFFVPTDIKAESIQYEKLYLSIVEKIKNSITIPIAVKLGCYFTNISGLVYKLSTLKVPAVVLFNRFYEPDIDIEKMEFKSADVFSSPSDIRQSLRWVGIISDRIPQIDIAASTGIHTGESVIKQLLAGAKAVQVCSTLYKNGIPHLLDLTEQLKQWMFKHNYTKIEDFRGMMNFKNIQNPAVYERIQFMKYFSVID